MVIEKHGNISDQEAKQYVEYLEKQYNRKLAKLVIKVCEDDQDEVDLEYDFVPVKIERIRRITGYLVGTMDKWNDAKTAEERDRVSHMSVVEKEPSYMTQL